MIKSVSSSSIFVNLSVWVSYITCSSIRFSLRDQMFWNSCGGSIIFGVIIGVSVSSCISRVLSIGSLCIIFGLIHIRSSVLSWLFIVGTTSNDLVIWSSILISKFTSLQTFSLIGGQIGFFEGTSFSSNMWTSLIDGLFDSMASVFHFSSIFVNTTERSFFFVQFRSVISKSIFNNSRFIYILLTILCMFIIFYSLVRSIFELWNMFGAWNISWSLNSGSFLFDDTSSLNQLFFGLII